MKSQVSSSLSWVEDLIKVFKLVEKGDFDLKFPNSVAGASPSLTRALKRMVESISVRQEAFEEDVRSAGKAVQELLSSYEELTALQLLSASLSTTFEFEEVISLFINLAGEIVQYESCMLFVPDRGGFSLQLSRNASPDLLQGSKQEIGLNLLQWSVRENKIVLLPYEEFVGKSSSDPRSFVIMPVISHQRVVAVLVLECPVASSQITQQQTIMLGLLSAQTAVACENANLYKGLQQKNVELAQLKNYLSNILENVTTGIMALDTAGHITSFNRAAEKIFRLKSEEVTGKPFYEVFQEPVRSTIRQLLFSSMVQQEVLNYELDAELGGAHVPLAFSTSLLRDENESPIGFVLACRDISETRELDAMRKLSQLKSEFLSSVSHELRTPLTSIKAYSETMLRRLDNLPQETLLECLRIVDSEADRLARLLDDLLDFSRMESGGLKLNFQDVDLRDVVSSAVNQMKLQSDRHTVVLSGSEEKMPASIDPDRVKQALINLISNAIKYSPEGGEISCKAFRENDCYHVVVKDCGMGISPENLLHVFEKFYRVEGPHMYKISGTGLGLSITKTIIEAHGGEIRAESKIGKGTTIHFTLPKLFRGNNA